MAQFFTDFTDNPGLIERWNVNNFAATVETSGLPSGATGGAAMRIMRSGPAARYAVTPDVFGVYSGDVEVVAKLQVAHNANVDNAFGVVLHGSGGAGSESGYGFTMFAMNTNTKLLTEYSNGTRITLATDSTFAYTRSTWYRMRLQRVDTTLRARIWADGATEPDTWLMSVTDDTLSSGWPGIWCGTSAGTVWCDFIGVGTDGDPAPMEPVGEPQELAGTAAAASDAEAALTLGLNLSGATAGASDAAGALTLGLNLSGATAGASAVDDATLTLGLNLSGSAAGVSAASGTLIAEGSLSGAASGVSDASATLTLGVNLSGSVAVASDASATLTRSLSLSGSVAVASDASATMLLGLNLSGSVDGASDASAAMLLGVNLSGSVAGASDASAALTRGVNLSGAVAGASDASTAMLLGLHLSGSVDGASDASATMLLGLHLSGSVDGASDASANLWLNVARTLPPAVLNDSSTRYTLVDSGVHHVLRRVR